MPDPICVHCGEPESEHHRFVPVKAPDGCRCDPHEWGNPLAIPDVCDGFREDPGGLCSECEHLKECHA